MTSQITSGIQKSRKKTPRCAADALNINTFAIFWAEAREQLNNSARLFVLLLDSRSRYHTYLSHRNLYRANNKSVRPPCRPFTQTSRQTRYPRGSMAPYLRP